MTIKPDEPSTHNEPVPPEAEAALRRVSTIAPEQSSTSPFRVLFAIVPMIVILAVGTTLLLDSTTPSVQEAAREERQKPAEPLRLDEEPFAPPEGPTTPPAEAGFDAGTVTALLAGASAEAGAKDFRRCTPCHSAEKDAPARVGPNLWGIVGREKAADPAYAYSAALGSKGGTWSYEELAAYLRNPREFAPGTKMVFAGIKDSRRIADLLAYLRTLADHPAPLPDQAPRR